MWGSGRFLCKRVDSLPKVFNARPLLRQCTNSTDSEGKIVIPKRIERGPTDILQALALTVNVDPTAHHYKYHDDPYFYPYSGIDKKVYALSKESGIKSAEWIIKENPKFFSDKLAEPPIKVFEPLTIAITEDDLTEEGLLNAIEERNVVSAMEIYNTLKSKQIDVQKSTKQCLLELVCFFNSEEKPNLDFEEKWLESFLGRAGGNIKKNLDWKGDFAQNLYDEMDPDCPLARSAIIQGMLKYMELKTAMALFKEAVEKNMKLPVNAYNAVLGESIHLMDQKSNIPSFIKDVLREMLKQNVTPNLGTLNGALKGLSRLYYTDFSAALMKEFIDFGVQPSLGSYGYFFRIISRLDSSKPEYRSYTELVHTLFNKIENEEHEILHLCDFSFFVNAIEAFSSSEGLMEENLPIRLHEMYMKPSNRKFVVRGSDDHRFYKILMPLLLKTQPMDVVMDFYRKHLYTLFTPESKVLTEILKAIQENHMPEYLPEIIRDLELLHYNQNRPMLGRVLQMIEDFTDENSLKVFREAAINYIKVVGKHNKGGDEDSIPFVLMAFLKNDDEENLEKTFRLIQEKRMVFKNIKESLVKSVFEFGMERKNTVILLESLNLAAEEEMESVSEMAEKALPFLFGPDKAWVSGLLAKAKESKKPSRKRSESKTEIPDV